MREIKFRAKDFTGTWQYGYVVIGNETAIIIPVNKNGSVSMGINIYVKPETIGQFVGLKDKNGKEIYEGDIVECVSWNEIFSKDGKPMEQFRRKMFVDYRKGGFKMVEPMSEPMNDNEWDIICNGDIVIIGNIYDDPQLIDMKRLS